MQVFEAPIHVANPTRNSAQQGGTALVQSNRTPVLWALAGFALLAVGLVYFISKPDSNTPEPPQEAETQQEELEASSELAPQPTAQKVGIEIEQEDPEKIQKQDDAIADLQEFLKQESLWSTVQIANSSESIVEVVTKTCEYDAMKPTLQKAAQKLREASFTTIHCIAEHGELLFKISL